MNVEMKRLSIFGEQPDQYVLDKKKMFGRRASEVVEVSFALPDMAPGEGASGKVSLSSRPQTTKPHAAAHSGATPGGPAVARIADSP